MPNFGMFENERTTTESLELLTKANQEANENRIKLNTLRQCYINLAKSYHQVSFIQAITVHDDRDWTKCNAEVCKSNYAVLVKLGLV